VKSAVEVELEALAALVAQAVPVEKAALVVLVELLVRVVVVEGVVNHARFGRSFLRDSIRAE
jgi:hypothetical protein